MTFHEFRHSFHICSHVFWCYQASDKDSGLNRQIDFEVTVVQFENDKNETADRKLLFEAVTTQQQDTFIGIIQ